MPMSGVRSQLLPWHGALSTRSFAPAASTAVWLASMASAGSFEPLGKYGVVGLPTVTLLSADTAPADGETASAISTKNTIGILKRRAVIGFPPRADRSQDTALAPCHAPTTAACAGVQGCRRTTVRRWLRRDVRSAALTHSAD